ncbi:MAG: hypothetical protein PHF13_04735 [Acholeplasmataceae bacterium]|jgi:hypothetical protein|nr:hypothetical protein [Acholeplasmataceae bacterium]
MTPDYSHSLEKPYKPLRRPYRRTDPRLKAEIQECILYYNDVAQKYGGGTIEWIWNKSMGYVLGRVIRSFPDMDIVIKCTIEDFKEILNTSGRWERHSGEIHSSGEVPGWIIQIARRLKPYDMPKISYYKEGKNPSDNSKRSTNSRSKRGDT